MPEPTLPDPAPVDPAPAPSPANGSVGGPAHDVTHEIVVIGAGPAGLTAAYELGKAGVTSTILEADTVVGGISRTAKRDGWRFDIGGHRFFTKVSRVEKLWHEILP
ncbi:MAG: NAD(P)-binding protein, partial [Acidimicrobiales bacterium]